MAKDLKTLLDNLESEGFEIKPAELINDSYIYKPGYSLESLGLAVGIEISYEPPHQINLRAPSFEAEIFVTRAKLADSLSEHYMDPEEDWDLLPKKLREEVDLLKRINDHLESFRFLEEISTSHNIRAFGDKTYGQFYGELVRQGKLKWLNLHGVSFPYVTTNSAVLGNVGASVWGLYFVATDLADEDWKEKVVAWHERWCQDKGHEFAVEKEIEFARELGKEDEHKEWRQSIAQLSQEDRFS